MFFNYSEGDYLLHPKYGIGRFIKIEYIVLNQSGNDFLKLEYLNNSYVYIPVYNMGILKFHSDKTTNTQIETLEKSKVLKKKSKIKGEIALAAKELMDIALIRNSYKVKPIELTIKYKEFGDSFKFPLTKTQFKAMKEIEDDLSIDRPMDRLLCGDVGFGKTEIAARAIALCVSNEQKALFISPTTILALQHYTVLKERFEKINKRCELYSKLSSKNFKKEWEEGKIDILISTIHHKYMDSLLIDNLGLVVLDEEHQFGVKFKEKIRQRANFLQLSATPIPRTLHLALAKIKDISTLEEPPYQKKETEVEIISLHELNLKDLIKKEQAKNGKVFIVVPRIQYLEEIKKMLDFTNFVILHGQLPKEEIKKAFDQFSKNEVNVMLATNIIESGVDIINANLMIIFHAHMFGVAQLHQLKGRVGRDSNASKVYFIMPKIFTDIAKERLNLIKDNAKVGGGFNLSMQDMEKRGAGTVLGTKQSGKDYGLGLEMYYEILSEELGKEINQKQSKNISWINFGDAYISNNYIEDENIRISLYKKLSLVSNFKDLEIIIEDLKGFGSFPEAMNNYLTMIRISILTQYIEIKQVICRNNVFDIIFSDIDNQYLEELTKTHFLKDNKIEDLNEKRLKELEEYFIKMKKKN